MAFFLISLHTGFFVIFTYMHIIYLDQINSFITLSSPPPDSTPFQTVFNEFHYARVHTQMKRHISLPERSYLA
jgi:hypothetical protein